MFEHYWEIQRAKAAGERDEKGFTLIELLIVIVVLGILAATVIFALGGVTGQSAVAACNSDAKSYEVAIAAYEAAPTNTLGTPPSHTTDLTSGTYGSFLHQASNNAAFIIALSGDTTLNGTALPAFPTTGTGFPVTSGNVYVLPKGGSWAAYDSEGTAGGCAAA